MQNAFKTISQSPKAAGTAGNVELTAARLEQGVTYYYIHLTTLLARGCSEFFRAAQRSS
jgi:hypothetical protein